MYHNATKFSAKNALLLAQLCNAAYGTETKARSLTGQWALPFRGGSVSSSLSRTPPRSSLVATSSLRLPFAEPRNQRMDDRSAFNPRPVRLVLSRRARHRRGTHAGFAFALRHSWEKIVGAMNRVLPPVATPVAMLDGISTRPQKTLWITGHSLGGALAALAGGVFSMLPGGDHSAGRWRLHVWAATDRFAQFLRSL